MKLNGKSVNSKVLARAITNFSEPTFIKVSLKVKRFTNFRSILQGLRSKLAVKSQKKQEK